MWFYVEHLIFGIQLWFYIDSGLYFLEIINKTFTDFLNNVKIFLMIV